MFQNSLWVSSRKLNRHWRVSKHKSLGKPKPQARNSRRQLNTPEQLREGSNARGITWKTSIECGRTVRIRPKLIQGAAVKRFR
jgi:tRNA G37 N-methylase TrmD